MNIEKVKKNQFNFNCKYKQLFVNTEFCAYSKKIHTHTNRDIQGFKGGAQGECDFFIRGETYNHYFH